MRLLHICSAYSKNELYSRFIRELAVHDLTQEMFVPVRSAAEVGEFDISNGKDISIKYDFVLRKYHRLFFRTKIKTVLASLEAAVDPGKVEAGKVQVNKKQAGKVDVGKVDLVHAHFLFSDGAVALKMKEKYGIPYIVAVRNTDINIFFKYLVHLRTLGVNILRNAEAIIFLSPAYKEYTFTKYIPAVYHEELNKKTHVFPNGADDFWLENQINEQKKAVDDLKLIFVGAFTPNKNVFNLVEAVNILKKQVGKVSLTLVGGGGLGSQKVHDFVSKLDPGVFKYIGRTTNNNELLQYYREADIFVLPSFKETFGIVYIEAMTQGLPIICSTGQGVDGYFNEDEPGRFVNPNDAAEIAANILKIYNDLTAYSENAIKHAGKFNWKAVSKEYMKIYKNVTKL